MQELKKKVEASKRVGEEKGNRRGKKQIGPVGWNGFRQSGIEPRKESHLSKRVCFGGGSKRRLSQKKEPEKK